MFQLFGGGCGWGENILSIISCHTSEAADVGWKDCGLVLNESYESGASLMWFHAQRGGNVCRRYLFEVEAKAKMLPSVQAVWLVFKEISNHPLFGFA